MKEKLRNKKKKKKNTTNWKERSEAKQKILRLKKPSPYIG